MRKSVLIGLGLILALAAVLGFVARQKQSGSYVEVMRPAAEPGSQVRSAKPAPGAGSLDQRSARGPDSQTRAWERERPVYRDTASRTPGSKQQIGGWQAVQLALDALNAFVGIIGIGLALVGMRMQRAAALMAPGAAPVSAPSPNARSQRAAIHTPDRISANPAA